MKYDMKYLWVLVFTLAMVGCGGGGGDSTVTPTLPKDATTIDDTNAYNVAWSAIGIFAYMREIEGLTAPVSDVIRMVSEKVFVAKTHRLRSTASREQITEECPYGGSVTTSYDETSTTYSASVSYEGCDEGYVITNGGYSYDDEWNSTGDYTVSSNGSMSSKYDFGTITVELDFEETGNFYDGGYSYIMDYSQSGDIYNYLFTTTQPFSGVYQGVNSGQVLVEGANNTKLLITVISINLAEVSLNNGSGTFVPQGTISF
ncbi:MAG: hypothetical protein GY820_16520 [Gammaproteobacteria bacterium]|nr:hypothetical protein [Gammaproteobacteria bacterium]